MPDNIAGRLVLDEAASKTAGTMVADIVANDRPFCALCNTQFTAEDDRAKNCRPLEVNRRWCVVHNVCPKELKV